MHAVEDEEMEAEVAQLCDFNVVEKMTQTLNNPPKTNSVTCLLHIPTMNIDVDEVSKPGGDINLETMAASLLSRDGDHCRPPIMQG